MSYADISDIVLAGLLIACVLGVSLGLFTPPPYGRGLWPFRRRGGM